MTTAKSVPVEQRRADAESTNVPAAPGPAHPISTLRSEIDRLFDDFFRGWPNLMSFPSRLFDLAPFRPSGEPLTSSFAALAPRVDVSETEDGYTIEAELPGVDEKDVGVTLSDGVLTIKGEKKAEREERKKDYYLSERSYGTMQRRFQLPEGIDTDKIAAEFKKGVLKVNLPKTKEAKAKERKIAIKAG